MAVVYNCFAHLESIALEVMNCYAEEAPDRFPTSACRRGVVSRGLATRAPSRRHRRVDLRTGQRRRTSSRSPTSSRGGASSSPPWPARCARRRTGRVSRVLLLFLALCRDPGARRTTSMPQPSAGPRREVAYALLRHRADSSRVPRRPFEDYRTTRHRRRRGTSSASSSGRSTARRRRPRTAGCTARATRYVFGVLCCGPGGRPSPSFDPSAGPRRAVACAGAHG